jgi:hypothetical protein
MSHRISEFLEANSGRNLANFNFAVHRTRRELVSADPSQTFDLIFVEFELLHGPITDVPDADVAVVAARNESVRVVFRVPNEAPDGVAVLFILKFLHVQISCVTPDDDCSIGTSGSKKLTRFL